MNTSVFYHCSETAQAGHLAGPFKLGGEAHKAAVEMNAFEESGHKRVLANMVQAYGIALEPEPEYKKPRDPEWAFMVTGIRMYRQLFRRRRV